MKPRFIYSIFIFALFLSWTPLWSDNGEFYKRRELLFSKIENNSFFIIGSCGREGLNKDFFYLTGIDGEGLLLLSTLNNNKQSLLFLPAEDKEKEKWVGHYLFPGPDAQKYTGIPFTLELSELEVYLGARLLGARLSQGCVLYYEPESIQHLYSNDIDLNIRNLAHEHGIPIKKAEDFLIGLRIFKSKYEIERIQKAIDITRVAIIEAMRSIEPDMWEYEIDALISYLFKRNGAKECAFPCIIGSGYNATFLHYDKNIKKMKAGELVVMDVGASFENYAADITRTVPVSGSFTPEQRDLYQIVLKAQQAAIEGIKPGKKLNDIHKIAFDIIDKAGYGKYFIHFTSHWLGLDVHDPGSRDMVLSPGMILTVEPGIYIQEKGIGIRIEDDVLVTDNGYQILSSNIPKNIEEIEELMKSSGIGNIRLEEEKSINKPWKQKN